MNKINGKWALAAVWTLSLAGIILPLYIWGDYLDWEIADELDALTVFHLLGLWAYFQMWVHYMVGPIKSKFPDALDYKRYYRSTSNFVLVCFLLHPALLIYAGMADNFTPLEYVGDSRLYYLLLAYFGLAVFIAYEFAEKMREKPIIKNNWETVKVLNIAAMTAIFIHSINLGQHLQAGWFRSLWIAMYVLFILVLVEGYIHDYKHSQVTKD